jgi:hypothetical protein
MLFNRWINKYIKHKPHLVVSFLHESYKIPTNVKKSSDENKKD